MMHPSPFDAQLAAMLAPPTRAPDRLFAAEVDRTIDDLARLRAAERSYARGVWRDLLALGGVLLLGLAATRLATGGAGGLSAILTAMPALLVLPVVLTFSWPQARRPRPDI